MRSFLVLWALFIPLAVAAQTCPVNTNPPSISGTPQVGQSLSVVQGTWTNNPITLFHQWFRNTSPPTVISAETSLAYIPTSQDVGFTISVEEVASNSSGPAQVVSAATAPIQASGGGITAINLTSGITSSVGTSVTTASISPTANTVVIAAVGARNNNFGAANVTPTLTGAGQTWTLLGTIMDGSGGSRSVTLFSTIVGSSPVSGSLTFSFGGTTEQNFMWSVDQFSGVNLSNPIVQLAGANPATATSSGITVNLAPLASGDASYGFVRQNVSPSSVSPGAGFTQLSNNTINSLVGTGEAEEAINLSSVGWTWSPQSTDTPVGMAIEIAHQ